MADETKKRGEKPAAAPANGEKSARQERLARALKANLQRRKAQSRARAAAPRADMGEDTGQ